MCPGWGPAEKVIYFASSFFHETKANLSDRENSFQKDVFYIDNEKEMSASSQKMYLAVSGKVLI